MAAAVIHAVDKNDAAETRYTESLTVPANSFSFFSLNSLAKKGNDACPVAWPNTAMGTANNRLA